MMLLVDTNALRSCLDEQGEASSQEIKVYPGYVKPEPLKQLDWSDSQVCEDMFYQLQLEMAASTNMRPIEKHYQLSPLMPDPYYTLGGAQHPGSVMQLVINPAQADRRTRLFPAVFVYTVLHGIQKLAIRRDEQKHELELSEGDVTIFLIEKNKYEDIHISSSDTAHAMAAVYYVVDPSTKFLPEDYSTGGR